MDSVLTQIQKDLNIPTFQFKAIETGERMTLSVFNGKPRVTVWPPDKSGTRGTVFSEGIPGAGWVMFKDMIRGGEAMNPGARKAILFNKWDRDQKKNLPAGTLVFGKDEKNQYYFELQWNFEGNNKVVKFNISAGNAIQDSASEFGWPERSRAQVLAIIDWMDTIVPVAICLTAAKNTFNKGGSGGGGGGAPGGYGKSF